MHTARQAAYEVSDASATAHHAEQTSGHHRNDDKVAHARNALRHGLQPACHGVGALPYANDARKEQADAEHERDVDARHSQCQHRHVGENAQGIHLGGSCCCQSCLLLHAQRHIYKEADHGRRHDDAEVGAKLVGHAAALGAGGRYGGVGNEGKVVAKERAAHHSTHHERDGGRRARCHVDGYGNEGYDGAHRRAHAQRHHAGGHKQAGQQHGAGQQPHGEVDRGTHSAHHLGRLRKGSCQHEYPYHEQEVGAACSCRIHLQALLHGKTAQGEEGRHRGDEEDHGHGHLAEVAHAQAQHAHEEGQQGQGEQGHPSAPARSANLGV